MTKPKPEKIVIPDRKESREFEQLALRQARANIKHNEHCLTLERLIASAYVEGFVHCFEVFSEMLGEGNIKRWPPSARLVARHGLVIPHWRLNAQPAMRRVGVKCRRPSGQLMRASPSLAIRRRWMPDF